MPFKRYQVGLFSAGIHPNPSLPPNEPDLLLGTDVSTLEPVGTFVLCCAPAAGFGVGAYAGGVLALRDGINRIINIPDSTLAAETRAT